MISRPSRMQALVLERYGGPECTVLREVSAPIAGAGELLVRVQAAGLNPVDFKTRAGGLKEEANAAMACLEAGHAKGKVVLAMS